MATVLDYNELSCLHLDDYNFIMFCDLDLPIDERCATGCTGCRSYISVKAYFHPQETEVES